jgi:hypothetical protein
MGSVRKIGVSAMRSAVAPVDEPASSLPCPEQPLFPRLLLAVRAVLRASLRAPCPSVVIMDGQSVKTTERGGIRGFNAHKGVKGRKCHIG